MRRQRRISGCDISIYCSKLHSSTTKSNAKSNWLIKEEERHYYLTKLDKGYRVVVMDKSDCVRLLKESSINDEIKFKPVSAEKPKMRGSLPTHFHPLLEKEMELPATVKRIFPQDVADSAV